MSIRNIILLFFSISIFAFFTSCDDDKEYSNETFIPADAQIYAFSATGAYYAGETDSLTRAKDSLAYIELGKTKFAIDQNRNIIYNPDSLPYGMILRNLKINMTVNSSYGVYAIEVSNPDSTYNWNYTDSINFSHGYIDATVKSAADTLKTKKYRIDLRVHQVNPEQIVWEQQTSLPSGIGEQKTILNPENNTFYTFTLGADGIPKVYTSSRNNISWTEHSTSGLPTNMDISSITLLNGKFYISPVWNHMGVGYVSSDGIIWAPVDRYYSHMFRILGILPGDKPEDDMMLVAGTPNAIPRLGKTKDLANITYDSNFDLINSGIPLYAATATNFSRNSYTNMLIMIENTGEEMPATWLIKDKKDGVVETTVFNNNNLFKAEGLSLGIYNNYLYVLADKKFYVGSNWGNSWAEAPEAQNLPEEFISISGQTMIVDESNYIWIFGGKSGENTYSTQVWKGRLNNLAVN